MYEESLNLKKSVNSLRTENTQLKTQVLQAQKELVKKDKEIKSFLDQLNNPPMEFYSLTKGQPHKKPAKTSTYLTIGLKKRITDLQKENKILKEGLLALKKSLKMTSTKELEVEVKSYSDECVRLRMLLDKVLADKPHLILDGNERLSEQLRQQSKILVEVKAKNKELEERLKEVKDAKKGELKDECEVQAESAEKKLGSQVKEEIKGAEAEASNQFNEKETNSKENMSNMMMELRLNLMLQKVPAEDLEETLLSNSKSTVSMQELKEALVSRLLLRKEQDASALAHYAIQPNEEIPKSEVFKNIRKLIGSYSVNQKEGRKLLLTNLGEKLGPFITALQENADSYDNLSFAALNKVYDELEVKLSKEEEDYVLATMFAREKDLRKLKCDDLMKDLSESLDDSAEVDLNPEHNESGVHSNAENDSPKERESMNGEVKEESAGKPGEEISESRMLSTLQKVFSEIASKIAAQGTTLLSLFADQIHKKTVGTEDIEFVSYADFMRAMERIGVGKLSALEERCLEKALAVEGEERSFQVGELAQILEEYVATDRNEAEARDFDVDELDKVSMVLLLALAEYLSNDGVQLTELLKDHIYKQPVQFEDNEFELEIVDSKDFFEVLYKIGIETNETEHDNLKAFFAIDENYTDKFSLDKLKSVVKEFTSNEKLRLRAKECYKELIEENQVQEESDPSRDES